MSGCEGLVTIDQLAEAKVDLDLLSNLVNGPNAQYATRQGESVPSIKRVMDTALAEILAGNLQNREVVNTLSGLTALERDAETREVLMLGYASEGDGGAQLWYLDLIDATPADTYPERHVSTNGDVWRRVKFSTEQSVSPDKFGGDFSQTEDFAEVVGGHVHLHQGVNLTAPVVITKSMTLDLGGVTHNLNDWLGGQSTVTSMFVISNGANVKFVNGKLEASNKVTVAMVDVEDGCSFESDGVDYSNTGASDVVLNNTSGVRSWDVTDSSVSLRNFKFTNVPLPIAMRGGFSIEMVNGEFIGYSRAIHELLSSLTLSPKSIYGKNLTASGVKPNATKFGFNINRQNGPRITCHPTYINCEVVGNVNASGEPITWIGGASPNNGHADMWPWQGVDGGTRINCGCYNGGDSGESLTRTTSNITNINCYGFNMEGQAVNCGSALSEVELNPATIVNFVAGEQVVIGAIGSAEITNISGNTITLGSQVPSNLLSGNSATVLDVVRGFTEANTSNASHQANIVSKTDTTIEVDNPGAFQVGNFVGVGPETSVGRFERTFDYTDRAAIIGNLVYGIPETGHQMRSQTTVATILKSTTGCNNMWIGGEYGNNGLNLDGQAGSFGNFLLTLHNNAQLINVKHGPAPNGVIITRSENCRIDCDLSETTNPILSLGGSKVFHFQSTISHDRLGRNVQFEGVLKPIRLGSASLPNPADADPGAIYFDVVEQKVVIRDSATQYVDLLGNVKQGDYWPHQQGVQLPIMGTVARPDPVDLQSGFMMWDNTINKAIFLIGATWRDADGNAV